MFRTNSSNHPNKSDNLLKMPENKSNKPKSKASITSTDQPTTGEIAAVAYSIWEQEGRPEGCDVEHWLKAEAQIRLHPRPVA